MATSRTPLQPLNGSLLLGLPEEILLKIFQQFCDHCYYDKTLQRQNPDRDDAILNRKALRAVSLVCKQLRNVAFPIIHHHIPLDVASMKPGTLAAGQRTLLAQNLIGHPSRLGSLNRITQGFDNPFRHIRILQVDLYGWHTAAQRILIQDTVEPPALPQRRLTLDELTEIHSMNEMPLINLQLVFRRATNLSVLELVDVDALLVRTLFHMGALALSDRRTPNLTLLRVHFDTSRREGLTAACLNRLVYVSDNLRRLELFGCQGGGHITFGDPQPHSGLTHLEIHDPEVPQFLIRSLRKIVAAYSRLTTVVYMTRYEITPLDGSQTFEHQDHKNLSFSSRGARQVNPRDIAFALAPRAHTLERLVYDAPLDLAFCSTLGSFRHFSALKEMFLSGKVLFIRPSSNAPVTFNSSEDEDTIRVNQPLEDILPQGLEHLCIFNLPGGPAAAKSSLPLRDMLKGLAQYMGANPQAFSSLKRITLYHTRPLSTVPTTRGWLNSLPGWFRTSGVQVKMYQPLTGLLEEILEKRQRTILRVGGPTRAPSSHWGM